jgi:hypothetical protein
MTVNEFLIVSDNANCLGIGIPEYIRRKTTGKAMPRTKVTPHYRKRWVVALSYRKQPQPTGQKGTFRDARP